ncbi:MAG: PaaI family thioesterase, partial [Acidimicrobiia bacterium]
QASEAAAQWAVETGLAGVVGVANQTDFLRPMSEGVLVGEATPVYRGRSQQLWQVKLTRGDDGMLVATGQVRLHNLKKRSQHR